VNRRLFRSRDDRIIGGVCGGVGDWLDVDASLVRVGWVLLTIFTGGIFLVLYVIMLIVVPEEPTDWQPGMRPPPGTGLPPAPDAVPGWVPPDAAVGSADAPAPGWTPPPGSVPPPGAAPAAGPVPPTDAATTTGTPATGAVPPAGAPSPSPGWNAPDAAYATRRQRRRERRRRNEGTGALVFGVILIALGAYFLLLQLAPGADLGRFWPVAIIVLGLALLVAAVRGRGEGDAG
jgi:phage shock protein PspC (stress-responsive transcriptional regulator)